MKELYDTPKMEVIEFESEDIITASGGGSLYEENELILDKIG